MTSRSKLPIGLVGLIGLQFVCAVFFVSDVIHDYQTSPDGFNLPIHLIVEAIATTSLVAAIVFEIRYLLSLLRQKDHLERSLKIASTEFYHVINAHFKMWKLSPSETDVANFMVKGLEISEIAQMRGCAEGTVKAHLNAIYRKSGTTGRGELLSVLIESLMVGHDLPQPDTATN